MNSLENRQLQLEIKPNNRTSGRLFKPPGGKVNPSNVPLMAWTYTSGQVNPDSDKIFNFSTKISDQQFGFHLNSVPRFLFGAPINQGFFLIWLDIMLLASSTLTDIKSLDFQYPQTFRALLGRPLLLRMALSLVPRQIGAPHQNHRLSHILTTQQYLRRVLDTTLNQGLINHHNSGLTSESSKTKKDPKELLLTSGYSDEAAYQEYLQRVLATTSNKGLHMQDDMGRSSQPPAALLPLCPQGKQDSGFPLAPHEKRVYPPPRD